MIRIYLDWNVISTLKVPEYKELKDFIYKHKSILQFPYSSAHFSDLMKSYTPKNELFNTDLDTLEYLSIKHFLKCDKNGIAPFFITPKQYFESINNTENLGDLLDFEKQLMILETPIGDFNHKGIVDLFKTTLKSTPSGIDLSAENTAVVKKMFPNLKPNSSMWDLITQTGPLSQKLLEDGDFYKDLRNHFSEEGFKLDNNSGNWSYDEVIKNIDKYIESQGSKITYLEFVESALKHQKEPRTDFEFFTSAYLMLDMIGYKKDKLPKQSDSMQNIQTDGEHSFYAAHCDYFVAMDKKLRIKSKVLYNEFNVPTKIIEPKDFISELSEVIDNIDRKDNFLEEAISFCNNEYLVESIPGDDKNKFETFAFKLPKYYFNNFNYLVFTSYSGKQGYVLTFKKVFKNFSRFTFYTESERVFDSVSEYFGTDHINELDKMKQEFVYGDDKETRLEWYLDNMLIRLEREEETNRPILHYIIATSPEK